MRARRDEGEGGGLGGEDQDKEGEEREWLRKHAIILEASKVYVVRELLNV